MRSGQKYTVSDAAWRLAGSLLLLSAWLIIRWIYRAATLPLPHELSLFEFAAVAVALLCGSAGSALTTLGAHLFEPVEISERWTPRHDPQARQRPPSPPLVPAAPDTTISSLFGGHLFPPNLIMAAGSHIQESRYAARHNRMPPNGRAALPEKPLPTIATPTDGRPVVATDHNPRIKGRLSLSDFWKAVDGD